MSNPLDSTLKAALAEPVTLPFYLVKLGFSTPSYMSSIEQISWNSQTWVTQSLEIELGDRPRIRIFNASLLIGVFMLSNPPAGTSVDIYQGYANDSAHPSPEHVFSGEMGEVRIGEYVDIACKRYPPAKAPRFYCTPPVFNHMPKTGTRFNTPGGVIVLESR
jgi:hypothetical protein